ncbi:MAG: GDSL-type esterase/lipase family protein [Acidobacteriota bacterium]
MLSSNTIIKESFKLYRYPQFLTSIYQGAKKIPLKQHITGNKTAHTILWFFTLVAIMIFIPSLEDYRLISAKQIRKMLTAKPTSNAPPTTILPQEAAVVQFQEPIEELPVTEAKTQTPVNEHSIEDATGHALDHFYASLTRTNAKELGAVTRIIHYGDSPLTADGITSTTRRLLQDQFGDSGHGFVLIDKPWGWYSHYGVLHSGNGKWTIDRIINRSLKDGAYGLGFVSFKSKTAGSIATFSTIERGHNGKSVSRFDIYYLAQPGGGQFSIEVDGIVQSVVSTDTPQTQSMVQSVNLPDGAHRLKLNTLGNGEVRLFGIVLERDQAGVVYDSIGINGAYIRLLTTTLNAEHWAAQLRERKPNLVILNYGTNESEFPQVVNESYLQDLKTTIARLREALPEASILLMAPMDRAERNQEGELVTRAVIPKIVEYQRRAAQEMGVAFFDTYIAMGGEGTMANWYQAQPRLCTGDLTHPTAQGQEIIGRLLTDALLAGYQQYQQQNH